MFIGVLVQFHGEISYDLGKLVGLVPTARCEIKKGHIFGGAFVPQLWQFFTHNNSTTVKFPFNWSQSDKKAMAKS